MIESLLNKPVPDITTLTERLEALLRGPRTVESENEAYKIRIELSHAMAGKVASQYDTWPPTNVPDVFSRLSTPNPEVDVSDLSPEVVISAIAHHGRLMIRGLFSQEQAERLIAEGTETLTKFRSGDMGPLLPENQWPVFSGCKKMRPDFLAEGNLLIGDSPSLSWSVLEVYRESGLLDCIQAVLGERPGLLWGKWGFRQTEYELCKLILDSGLSPWHQDGSFMGDGSRVINAWIALCECGGDSPTAPSMSIIPRKFNGLCQQGTGNAARFDVVGEDVIEELNKETPIDNPHFQVGDALIFDKYMLHRTQIYSPSLNKKRFALESWFAGLSNYDRSPFYKKFPLIAC